MPFGMPEVAVRSAGLWPYLNELFGWQDRVTAISQDGAALTNTVTATSLLAASSKIVIPKSAFVVGRVLKVTAAGRVSNLVTTPGTLTLDLRAVGASTVVIANGGAMALNIVAKVNVPWYLEWLLTVRAVGAAANVMHQGKWISESVIASPLPSVGGASTHMLPNATPAVGSNFDSTVNQTLDLFATWSVANAANSIQLHQFAVEEVPS
jgi:hypothetical protein